MQKISVWKRLRYRFDNTMAKGTPALIMWLFIASFLMIAGFSILVILLQILPQEGGPVPFSEVIWLSMMRALDPGTVAGDEGPWLYRLAMFVITLGGLFLVSILIGVVTSGIESRIEDLRKGRSFVVENDHTIILGWGPQIFSIISELVIANANQKNACITVMANRDKVAMEDEIRNKVGETRNTRIVVRTGNPIDLADLEIVNLHAARSILLPAPEVEDPDTNVIKSILAITNNPNRREEPYHIVAELRHPANLEVARLVGKEETELILADEVISRITVQASLQSGLSVVYTELLDFSGDEIYFHEEPALVGKTFGEALSMYEDSALIGLRFQDGKIALNPGMDVQIPTGAQIIAISEDDDTVQISTKTIPDINQRVIRAPDYVTIFPSRTLILGWNRRAPAVINELDHYLTRGSHITVVGNDPDIKTKIEMECGGVENCKVEFIEGDITSRADLESINIVSFKQIVLLSYSDQFSPQQADAHTLVTLLHLRDIADLNRGEFSITTEMLEVENRDLAIVTRADDFIVSNRLISLLLSQISENKEIARVFESLFETKGSELYLKPIGDYVEPNNEVNFYTLVEAARRKTEVAIGYRMKGEERDREKMYGVHINPNKSESVTFSWDDKLIVLANN